MKILHECILQPSFCPTNHTSPDDNLSRCIICDSAEVFLGVNKIFLPDRSRNSRPQLNVVTIYGLFIWGVVIVATNESEVEAVFEASPDDHVEKMNVTMICTGEVTNEFENYAYGLFALLRWYFLIKIMNTDVNLNFMLNGKKIQLVSKYS